MTSIYRTVPVGTFFIVAILMGLFGRVSEATAEMDDQLEPEYSLAVLDYNAQNFDSALKMLNQLQKEAPETVEILELKAITLKAMKNQKGAANVYRDLVQIKTKEGKSKKEIAPYAFELGVIRYNEKNWKQAEQYLNYSDRNGFNVEVSEFYLGLIEVQIQDWARAEEYLTEVLRSELDELKPAANYYLSQVHFKLGYPSEGFADLIAAKKTAQKYIDRDDVTPDSKKMAEQVKVAAESTLAPFDKGQKFGTFSLMMGYDSNVLLDPSGADTTSASGQSTLKTTVAAGFGYASSPLAKIQYVPSVRFSFNKNFNSASTEGEFADTTFSLYLTKDALAAVSWGLKTEGNFVFQDQVDTTGSKAYHLYDDSVDFAPYLKWDASKRWTYAAEVGYQPISYAGEDVISPSDRRSGHSILTKWTAQNKANRKYFNPTYALRLEFNLTQGTEFANNLYGLQVLNMMKIREIEFSQILEVDHTTYGTSAEDRDDTLYLVSLLASKKIGPRWAVLASSDYTINGSSVPASYSYNRFTINAGVGYNF